MIDNIGNTIDNKINIYKFLQIGNNLLSKLSLNNITFLFDLNKTRKHFILNLFNMYNTLKTRVFKLMYILRIMIDIK